MREQRNGRQRQGKVLFLCQSELEEKKTRGHRQRAVPTAGKTMREKLVSPPSGWLNQGRGLPNMRLDRWGTLDLPGSRGLSKEKRLS